MACDFTLDQLLKIQSEDADMIVTSAYTFSLPREHSILLTLLI
jgi:hypothetical protein